MNKCLLCKKETNNPVFCSRSCAAIYNNSHFKKRKPFPKKCPNCGKFLGEFPGYAHVCQTCKNKKNLSSTLKTQYEHVRDARRRNKLKLINEFGGKCVRCGYDKYAEVLEFHHRNDSEKSFSISANLNKAYSLLLEEAKKCDLLCANCHREVHVENKSG